MLVIGAGPAGWAAAGALCRRGLAVTLVAPEPEAPFRNGYGVWVDEVSGFESVLERTWPRVRVHGSDTAERAFARAYGRVANDRLRERLLDDASSAVRVVGVADAVEPEGDRFWVRTSDGTLGADLVIDASGHESRLLRHRPGPAPGWQVAYGIRAELERGHRFPEGEAVLMDFRPPDRSTEAARVPSFLYVLPEDERVVFFEETSLVARPGLPIEQLEARLQSRLGRLGVSVGRVLEVERCFIPMGGPPPPAVQPVVGFGGAARQVHPASGYLLARVLRTAPRLAAAVAEGLESGEDRDARSARAWAAVWSRDERVAHDLFRFGSEVLLGLDTAQLQRFFTAFFSLPDPLWTGYLSGTASPSAVRAAMLGVFAAADWDLRRRLVGAGLGPRGPILWSALWPWR